MKLNIVDVINEVINENESEVILIEFYSHNSLMDHYRDLYNYEAMCIESMNNQTWEMVHHFESRYGLDYVNNELNWYIEEIPTFEQWLNDFRTQFITE